MAERTTLRNLVIVVVVVVVAAILVWPGPRRVEVRYVGPETGCVTLDPSEPEIWQNRLPNLLKKKWVKWVVTKSQKNQYYWEFEYDPSGTSQGKPQGTGDYLGPVEPITCQNPQHTTSQKVGDQGQDVEWPYKITVYECVDGSKGGELCPLDPVIWIRR